MPAANVKRRAAPRIPVLPERNVIVKRAPAGVAPAETEAEDEPFEPPIRLRTLLVLGVIALAVWMLEPRAKAAWQLHGSATALADYALCMVGPTGPALLRDNPTAFRSLVRRRLIASEANDRPFQDCAKLSRDLTDSVDAERAHRATAWSFAEYGGAAADRAAKGASELSVDSLAVDGKNLATLAKDAWPFVRDGYTKLVRPSLSAREAVHPVELPRPSIGRGLPAWHAGYRSVGEVDGKLTVAMGSGANLSVFRSSDAGQNWQPAPVRGVESFAGRCTSGDRSYAFSLSADTHTMLVTSAGPDATPHSATLMKADDQLLAASCDERALVAAVRSDSKGETTMIACVYGADCHPMPPPVFPGVGPATSYPLDLARVQGTTVVAVAMHGIVRVASSRDEGRSWTPFSVAYDDAEHRDLRVSVRLPTRLLAVGKRVLLYGGAPKPGDSYSLLVSDDLGASWRPFVPSGSETAKRDVDLR